MNEIQMNIGAVLMQKSKQQCSRNLRHQFLP